MNGIKVSLPLDETVCALIAQVVSLQTELIIQQAYISALSKLVNPALDNHYQKLHDELFHPTFVEQLDKLYPSLSDGLRDWILQQLQNP
ncbi:MAG: hypothetical protein RJA25_2233 [Bacteroidota bacterium]|jgi:hypothetical protein